MTNGFSQGFHEKIERKLCHGRLIGHGLDSHAERQVAGKLLDCGPEVGPQLDGIAAPRHHHGDTNGILAADAHLRIGWVGQAALHLGNVAEAELPATDRECRGANLLHRIEATGHTQAHAVAAGLDKARRDHGVLFGQRLGHLPGRQPKARQSRRGDFDVDLFILHAEQIDFFDIRDGTQFARHAQRDTSQLGHIVTIAAQRVDIHIDIAEFVIRKGALHARRQLMPDVVEFLAHLPPRFRHLRLGRVVLENHEYQRFSRARSRLDHIHIRRFLQFLLDALGHFGLDLAHCRARPLGTHHHHLEGEVRIFGATELEECQHAAHHQHNHQIKHHRGMLERPF